MKKFEIYFNDLNESAQKELIEMLNGENGNYDVIPLATIEFEEDECPFGGDIENDCADCIDCAEYHYVKGECVKREEQE